MSAAVTPAPAAPAPATSSSIDATVEALVWTGFAPLTRQMTSPFDILVDSENRVDEPESESAPTPLAETKRSHFSLSNIFRRQPSKKLRNSSNSTINM